MEAKVKISEGVSIEKKGSTLIFKKGQATIQRTLSNPIIDIKIEKGNVVISSKLENRNAKKLVNTFESHIHNMIRGLEKPFVYKMKICSSHFPMSVKVEGEKVIISNFVGEKKPRFARIIRGAKVEVSKEGIVSISSPDIEAAGLTVGNIENATRVTYRDRRILQDGIFIIEKPEKK
ncbi:50S ribosomal protein L6 [Candidatus Tiddalikarchaeum anstoanum]|nr:50S ribosomal protein L6 [Candidatus Tiddalikarchaeum anstoanum]